MGKASRRKRQDAATPPPARPPYPEPPRWSAPTLAVAAAAGIVLASVSTYVGYQLARSGGAYASFCNVSATVNCDSVMTSRFAKLFGLPVSVWAIAFYAALLVVALRASGPASESRDRARADALGLAIAGALFSAYMAVVSLAVLRVVCIVCAGLYVASTLALVAAWKLAAPLAEGARRLRERWELARRRPALTGGAVLLVALLLLAPRWLGAPTQLSREEIFRANPQFYDWYTSRPVVDAPTDGGHAQGPENAPIQLIEFSDFQCPYCSRAHVTLKDLLSRYRGQVRFVFHHFPLSNECNDAIEGHGHEHACRAAVAAECAGEQERFDPFANLLFAKQDDLGDEALKGYARDAGLDVGAFEKCRAGEGAAANVKSDIAAAKRAGVRSTPTFFVNGRKIEGTLKYEDWLLAFAIELDKS